MRKGLVDTLFSGGKKNHHCSFIVRCFVSLLVCSSVGLLDSVSSVGLLLLFY